jgi:hypothetical protein
MEVGIGQVFSGVNALINWRRRATEIDNYADVRSVWLAMKGQLLGLLGGRLCLLDT